MKSGGFVTIAEQIPPEKAHPFGKQTVFVLKSWKQSTTKTSEQSAAVLGALPLVPSRDGRGSHRADLAAGQEMPSSPCLRPGHAGGRQHSPRSAGSGRPALRRGKGAAFALPRALHTLGQRTKPPAPPRAQVPAAPRAEPRCLLAASRQHLHQVPPACGRW